MNYLDQGDLSRWLLVTHQVTTARPQAGREADSRDRVVAEDPGESATGITDPADALDGDRDQERGIRRERDHEPTGRAA
jgi:hypothetical protein